MSGIVCAIWGGPDSHPTIATAINLAKKTNLTIYFLYIVNLEFLEHTISSRIQIISAEMKAMGEFILFSAQKTAESEGVTTQGVIRQGNVMEEISGLCHEIGADYLVLGRPKVEKEQTLFTHEQLNQFIQTIEQQTGAKVILSPENTQ